VASSPAAIFLPMQNTLHRFSGADDRHIPILLQIQHMRIAGDDVIGLRSECTG